MNVKNEKEPYDCQFCCYRDNTVEFCGFCMRRILDEWNEGRKHGRDNAARHKEDSDGKEKYTLH